MAEIYENKTFSMTLRDDGILELKSRKDAEYTKNEVSDLVLQKNRWTPKKLPLLVIDHGQYTTAAELYVDGIQGLEEAISAVAYHVLSPFDQSIAEIKTDLIFKNIPSKIFTNMDQAVDWLKGYL
jgi:hypothetical protein